jgi:hypothetical protein
MAEGIKDNIEGAIKVAEYIKKNVDEVGEGISKVGKFVKSLWNKKK